MTISAVFALVILSALVYFALKKSSQSSSTRRRSAPSAPTLQQPTFDLNIVPIKWREIQSMKSNGPSGLRNALMEADKLLDYTMQAKRFKGDTMGERLKSGGRAFSNLNQIWAAHKLRNVVAHEVAHDMVPSQIERAITDLGEGIKQLGVSL